MRVKYISERVEAIPEKLLQYSIETWALTPGNEYVVFALCTMCGEPWYLLCDDYYRADNIDSFPCLRLHQQLVTIEYLGIILIACL